MSHWYEPARSYRAVDAHFHLPNNAEVHRIAEAIERERAGSAETTIFRPESRAIGLFGERHVARWLRVKMDIRVRKKGGNRRANLRMANGWRVDVITRTMLRDGSYPDLTMKVASRGRVDALVLVIWHGESFEPEIGGWISQDALKQRGQIEDYRGSPNYIYPYALLRPFSELLAHQSPERAALFREEFERRAAVLSARQEEEPEESGPEQLALLGVA